MKTNYETDFYSWTQQQAALMRAGRFSELDIENIVEEIETMGRSEKREIESRMAVLMAHLLKWQYQPERRTRSWRLTIEEQRIKLAEVVDENPGLRPQFAAIQDAAYRLAVIRVLKETRLDESVFPKSCSWSFSQLLDENYYPD